MHLRFLPLFLAGTLALSSCGKKSDDPQARPVAPAAPHIVTIRLSGTWSGSPGAVAEASVLDSTNTRTALAGDVYPAPPYTHTVTTVDLGRTGQARAHLTFMYINATRPPAGTYLQAEFLVGGVVKKVLRLDENAASASNQHPEIGISYTYADLLR